MSMLSPVLHDRDCFSSRFANTMLRSNNFPEPGLWYVPSIYGSSKRNSIQFSPIVRTARQIGIGPVWVSLSRSGHPTNVGSWAPKRTKVLRRRNARSGPSCRIEHSCDGRLLAGSYAPHLVTPQRPVLRRLAQPKWTDIPQATPQPLDRQPFGTV